MCGRYTITTDVDELAARFTAHLPYKPMPPRFNVAPGQMVSVILNDEGQLMVPPMSPYDSGEMKSYQVSNKVNRMRYD